MILGPGGTGKTTLARILAGDVNVLIDLPPFYDPNFFVESVPLLDAPGIELVVAPGQEFRLQREFGRLMADLVKGLVQAALTIWNSRDKSRVQENEHVGAAVVHSVDPSRYRPRCLRWRISGTLTTTW